MNRRVRPHPLTGSKYFNKYTARNDLMHCMDHHGVYGAILGSVIWYLVVNNGKPSLGLTQPERLETINMWRKDYYEKNKGISSRIDTIEEKNVKPSGAEYAVLHGTTIKAANTRGLVPFLKVLADKFLTDVNELDHVLMHELIKHTIKFNDVIYSSGTFLTQSEIEKLTVATQGVGKYMQLLRSRAKADKQMLWYISPKTHYMQHFPDEARLINPRVVQCYIEESFIGKIAAIWASTKNGPYSQVIQRTALLKYLVWLVIELDL